MVIVRLTVYSGALYVCNFNYKFRASNPIERSRRRGGLPENVRDVNMTPSDNEVKKRQL